jgi:hypothetical protein
MVVSFNYKEKTQINNSFGFKYHKMVTPLELQHVIFPHKFQKLTKAGGLTTKTALQP